MGKIIGWKQGSIGVIKTIVVVSLFALLLSQVGLNLSYADNAEVLPKGVSGAGLNGKFYLNVDEKYDPDGNPEDAAIDLNATLNSMVFSDLALVEAAFGLPAGSANIGKSVVSFDYDFNLIEFTYQYGITDKLSLGIMIPYWDVKNNVGARVDASNATVGSNPFLGNPLDPFLGAPFIPVALGGVPLTTDQVQDLLVENFGYKRVESWSGSGISDIEAGLRYQYLKTEDWRLAFTGGVRLPTGRVDDPDSLVDFPFGSGAWALLFHFNHDYIAIKNLVLNATFRYELYLPDKEVLRVLDDVNRPITANKEEIDRDYGDIFELELSGAYQFSEGFTFSLLYKLGLNFRDDISGNMGFTYEALEKESDYTEHVGIIGLSYSTVPLWKAKKFRIPLTASISYRDRFAGSNNVLKSQYIEFGIQVFF